MILRGPEARRAFVLEQTKLLPVPFVPEIRVYTAPAVNQVWFETARWLNDDQTEVPFWCVPWAGGQALARHLLKHPELMRGQRVLDFACGGGVVAIAAARAGARVTAVDIDPLAIAATRLAAEANDVALDVQQRDLVGDALLDFDAVVAGDVWYERGPSTRFLRWFSRLVTSGRPVFTGDAGRGFPPRNAEVLAEHVVPTPFDLESTPERATRVLAIR